MKVKSKNVAAVQPRRACENFISTQNTERRNGKREYPLSNDEGEILIIRPGALGDAILTLPLLHALRLAGVSNLTVLGTPASWGFLSRGGDAPRIVDFSSTEWLGLFAEGAGLSVSAAELLGRTRTALIYLTSETDVLRRRLAGAGVERIICATPPLQDERAPDDGREHHASKRLLAPLRGLLPDALLEEALAIAEEDLASDVFLALTPKEVDAGRGALLSSHNPSCPFFALHPGSGGRRKCWPAKHFAALAERLFRERQWTPALFFGPADAEAQREFEAALPAEIPWLCLAQRPLREVMAVLNCCRGYAGNDSGLTHLAARCCPVLALFGPTDPRVWKPLGRRVSVLHAHGGNLEELSVATVFERL